MKKYIKLSFLLIIFATLLTNCARPPQTFRVTTEPVWKQIELKDGLKYDNAWKQTVDITTKKYDIEFLSKEDGYIRTAWIYHLSNYGTKYSARVIIKFNNDNTIGIKTDAKFSNKFGYDMYILNDVYNDLSALLGRTMK